jgi:hypothetical protein
MLKIAERDWTEITEPPSPHAGYRSNYWPDDDRSGPIKNALNTLSVYNAGRFVSRGSSG